MGEIVVKGETFKIKGDQPTPKEQLAIDTVIAAKNKGGGVLNFNDQLSLQITPEDVLSDAVKGKYNQDTEDFLSSPEFGRIVAEVGLSIAGGIAGMAAAPFTGGTSLVGTGLAAARIARIARPLLNLSAKKQKFVGAVAGAGIGGGAGAAIAQTFDPRESIVREVARGTAQGAFGEVLGFGMAAGLAKGYNKIMGAKVAQLDGAKDAAATLARDTEFFKSLKELKDTGKIDPLKIKKFKEGVKNKGNPNIYDINPATKEQLDILTTPNLSAKAIAKAGDLLEETKSLTGSKKIGAELASINPAKMTENSAVETLSGAAAASMFGGGIMRGAERLARKSTAQNIENFVDTTLYNLPRTGVSPEEVNMTIGELINTQITKQHGLYNDTVNKMWNEITAEVNKLRRPDGTFDPKYDVVFGGEEAAKKLTVTKTPYGKEAYTETVNNLGDYIDDVLDRTKNLRKTQTGREIDEMVGPLMAAGGRTDWLDFKEIYSEIGSMNVGARAKPVQAELLARMQSLLNDSPLPGNVGLMREDAANFTRLGARAFSKGVLKSMMNKEKGLEVIYQNIIASGDRSYYQNFFNLIDKGKFSYKLANGTTKSYDMFPNKELMKDALRGQFFKNYLKASVGKKGQYPTLNAAQSKKFLDNYDYLLKEDFGFLTKSQIDNIKQYNNRIQFTEGALKPAGEAGSNPGMYVQLNQAGQISQIIGVIGFGSGTIDPGPAAFFVLGPVGLSKAFANPKINKLMMDGLGGGAKTIDSYPKLERYIGQLATAMVGEGIVSAQQAEEAVKQVQANKDHYERYFETGKYDGSIVRKNTPADAPSIDLARGNVPQQPQQDNVPGVTTPLPNVTPANLPMTGQTSTERALALDTVKPFG